MNQPTAKTRKGRKKWVALRDGGICEVTTIRTDWKATCGVYKGYIAHLEGALEAARQARRDQAKAVHAKHHRHMSTTNWEHCPLEECVAARGDQ